MDDLTSKCIELAKEYPLKDFDADYAHVGTGSENDELESCDNHRDAAFIEKLNQYLYLDTNIIPL